MVSLGLLSFPGSWFTTGGDPYAVVLKQMKTRQLYSLTFPDTVFNGTLILNSLEMAFGMCFAVLQT